MDTQCDVGDLPRARSFLFVPGDRPDRFPKAQSSGADMVILDLEDSVAPHRRMTARLAVQEWLERGHRAAVRVNAADTQDHPADLAAIEGTPGLAAIVVPKAEDVDALRAVKEQVQVPLLPLIETAAGLFALTEITRIPGVCRLAFGHLDFSLDVGTPSDSATVEHARVMIVIASRAAALAKPVDGVTAQVHLPDRLVSDLAEARALGFGGKLLIHPRQVQSTNVAFQPTDQDVAWAAKVLAAADDVGVILLDGVMIDEPARRRADMILRAAQGAGPVTRGQHAGP